jgi:hypothetical protein
MDAEGLAIHPLHIQVANGASSISISKLHIPTQSLEIFVMLMHRDKFTTERITILTF